MKTFIATVVLLCSAQVLIASELFSTAAGVLRDGYVESDLYAGTLGNEFVLTKPVYITGLGYYDGPNSIAGSDGDGLNGNHRVGIWQNDNRLLLSDTTVTTADAAVGPYRYSALPGTGTLLLPGTYRLGGLANVADRTPAGDVFRNGPQPVTAAATAAGISTTAGAYSGPAEGNVDYDDGIFRFPGSSTVTERYVGPSLQFQALPAAAISLSLADMVGGGNGKGTGTIDTGVSITTGAQTASEPGDIAPAANTYLTAPNTFVDGVFVPDSNNSATAIQVSSTGLTYTLNASRDELTGNIWNHVWNGHNDQVSSTLVFDEIIGMHSAKGITFDLQAISADNGGMSPLAFTGYASTGRNGATHLYVLVDGVLKSLTSYTGQANTATYVYVPLASTDRFVTLMTTAQGSYGDDWAFWGDASITLVPEPTSAILWLVGMAAVWVSRRRHRSLR